jgi:hypothetical protein
MLVVSIAQWLYSRVSSASLQKMGVFFESDGDFRDFSAENKKRKFAENKYAWLATRC